MLFGINMNFIVGLGILLFFGLSAVAKYARYHSFQKQGVQEDDEGRSVSIFLKQQQWIGLAALWVGLGMMLINYDSRGELLILIGIGFVVMAFKAGFDQKNHFHAKEARVLYQRENPPKPKEEKKEEPKPFTFPHELRLSHAHVVAGCLHPDTPIYDPITNTTLTVKERSELGVFFNVYSIDKRGKVVIGTAAPPIKYTKEPMLRFSNGNHTICVTHNHKFWNGCAYVPAKQLLQSGSCRLPTTSVLSLRVWFLSVQHWKKITASFRFGCRSLSRLCGLQPRLVLRTSRYEIPSQVDAPSLDSAYCDKGVSGRILRHIRFYQSEYRLSKRDCVHQHCNKPSASASVRTSSSTYWLSSNQPQDFFECTAENDQHHKVRVFSLSFLSQLVHGCASRLSPMREAWQRSSVNGSQGSSLFPFVCGRLYKVLLPYLSRIYSFFSYKQPTIWTAEPALDETYYDFHVFVHNNYYACGLFNHNSGVGKSQLIQNLVWKDVQAGLGCIVIDSQGEMIKKLARRIPEDKLVLFDPEYCPPALNIFSQKITNDGDLGTALEFFEYIFSALDSQMTAKQQTAYRFICRLLLEIPGANIHTMRELLEPNGTDKYQHHINSLGETAQSFFDNEYNSRQFADTRQQILRRLYTVLENKTMEQMLGADSMRVDFGYLLSRNKVILINTNKAYLKQMGASLFGRIFLSQLMQAAFKRGATQKRTHVYIDEFQDYAEESSVMFNMFEQARKYGLGFLVAHQYLGQLPAKLRQSIAANTAIKMAAGLSAEDERAMSSQMHTDADTIHQAPKGSFLLSMRDKGLIYYNVAFGALETEPVLNELKDINDKMRKAYGGEKKRQFEVVSKVAEPEAEYLPKNEPQKDEW